jgi:hypothetical protein
MSANHVSARLLPERIQRQGGGALDLHELPLIAKMTNAQQRRRRATTADSSESSSACHTRSSNARPSAAT